MSAKRTRRTTEEEEPREDPEVDRETSSPPPKKSKQEDLKARDTDNKMWDGREYYQRYLVHRDLEQTQKQVYEKLVQGTNKTVFQGCKVYFNGRMGSKYSAFHLRKLVLAYGGQLA